MNPYPFISTSHDLTFSGPRGVPIRFNGPIYFSHIGIESRYFNLHIFSFNDKEVIRINNTVIEFYENNLDFKIAAGGYGY